MTPPNIFAYYLFFENMARKLIISLLLVVYGSCLLAVEELNPFCIQTSLKSVVVMDIQTGEYLFSKNPNLELYPASTMKVVTALLCYEKLKHRLNEEVTITKEMISSIDSKKKIESKYKTSPHLLEKGSSHMGLKVGEKIPIKSLFQGAMIASANDACNALALTAFASYEKFTQNLNRLASSKGSKRTHFMNAHGLHHPDQKTTADDLAKISLELLKKPFLAQLGSCSSFKRPQTNLQKSVYYAHTNALIRPLDEKYYSKAYGLKTGYTSAAGANLIACANDNGRKILIVAFSGKAKTKRSLVMQEVQSIFEAIFKEKKSSRILVKKNLALFKYQASHLAAPLQAHIRDDVVLEEYPSMEKKVKGVVAWDELIPPIRKDQYVGSLQIMDHNGKQIDQRNLYAQNDVIASAKFSLKKINFFISERIRSSKAWTLLAILMITLFLLPLRKRLP